MAFSLAISINAFLIGIATGMIAGNWMIMVASIVLITYVASLVGVRIGKMGRYKAARNAEVFGGVILLGMAVFMIVQYIKMG
jgi:putative Mn2+ efflux pump MntP